MSCCCGHHRCCCGSGHHGCGCHGHHSHGSCGCHERRSECSCHGERESGHHHGRGHRFPSREEYVARLEEEQDLLERRLRFLKQELAELQANAGHG